MPRSAILIIIGGCSGAGGLSESAIGIGTVLVDTSPGQKEDSDVGVTGVGGGAAGGDVTDVGVKDVDAIAMREGLCVLVG